MTELNAKWATNFSAPARMFVKQGPLIKTDRHGNARKYTFLLFNDLIVYGEDAKVRCTRGWREGNCPDLDVPPRTGGVLLFVGRAGPGAQGPVSGTAEQGRCHCSREWKRTMYRLLAHRHLLGLGRR